MHNGKSQYSEASTSAGCSRCNMGTRLCEREAIHSSLLFVQPRCCESVQTERPLLRCHDGVVNNRQIIHCHCLMQKYALMSRHHPYMYVGCFAANCRHVLACTSKANKNNYSLLHETANPPGYTRLPINQREEFSPGTPNLWMLFQLSRTEVCCCFLHQTKPKKEASSFQLH